MINWLKHNWWKVLIALFGPMIILDLTMDLSFVNSWSRADDSAWLGFWGGYLGSLISVGGVYWQVRKELANNNENQYKEARPIFMLNIMDGLRSWESGGPIDYNIMPVSLPAYVSKDCCIKCKYRFGWCKDSSIALPYIQLVNISENPMLAIKIDLIWSNKSSESFYINRISSDSDISLVSTFTYRYYNDYHVNHIPQSKIELDKLEYIKIYYLTAQNEKTFMKFKVKEGYQIPTLIEKRLEGKGDSFSLDEYQIDNFVENKKILTE